MKNRKRNRLLGYDYSNDNLYFVTICVQDRICCFGAGIAGFAGMAGMAGMAGTGRDLSVHDANKNDANKNDANKNDANKNILIQLNQYGLIVQERIEWLCQQYQYIKIHNYVVMPTHIHLILEIDSTKLSTKDVKIKSLSSLIGALKTTSSKLIHLAGFEDFAWQRSFHDVIIRDEKSFQNISNYIDLNPQKWLQDSFFKND
jgi:putative transposase